MRSPTPEDLIPTYLAEIDATWREHQRSCPPIVYHYTSVNALRGILDSQRIWATHALETNDTTELSYSIAQFKSVIERHSNAATLAEYQVLYPPQVYEFDYLRGAQATAFVACFSGKEDDLPQWNLYGDAFRGVAIGFDSVELTRLDRAELSQSVGFVGIEYGQKRQDEFFEQLLSRWERDAASAIGRGLARSRNPLWYMARWFAPLATSALTLFPRMKDPSFYSEDEWRIAHFHIGGVTPCCQVHSSADFNTRVELDLGQLIGRVPIVSVWLGPGIANAASVDRIRKLLQAHGYDIPVETSKVPFRINQQVVSL